MGNKKLWEKAAKQAEKEGRFNVAASFYRKAERETETEEPVRVEPPVFDDGKGTMPVQKGN